MCTFVEVGKSEQGGGGGCVARKLASPLEMSRDDPSVWWRVSYRMWCLVFDRLHKVSGVMQS
jgi:hypothetical protein